VGGGKALTASSKKGFDPTFAGFPSGGPPQVRAVGRLWAHWVDGPQLIERSLAWDGALCDRSSASFRYPSQTTSVIHKPDEAPAVIRLKSKERRKGEKGGEKGKNTWFSFEGMMGESGLCRTTRLSRRGPVGDIFPNANEVS